MQREAIEVGLREGSGKGPARQLRASGRVPAVVYGSDLAPVHVQVDRRRLERVMQQGSNALIDLSGVDAVKGKVVIVKEFQRNPVSRKVIHCDFYAVDLRRTIEVDIPIHFAGKAKGVEMGGVLEPLLRELRVKCLPLEIPDAFTVDVSELEIGDGKRVEDIRVPDNLEVMIEGSVSVIHVIAPRVEEEPVAEEALEDAVEGEEAPAEGAAPAEPAEPAKEEGKGD